MIRPLFDRLYIIPLEDPNKYAGSIIVPDEAKQRPDQGIVKYRGPLTSGEVKVGDHVIFSGYDGTQMVTEDDGLLIVMPEDFVQAIHADVTKSFLFTENDLLAMLETTFSQTYTSFGGADYVGEDVSRAMNYIRDKFTHLLQNHHIEKLNF